MADDEDASSSASPALGESQPVTLRLTRPKAIADAPNASPVPSGRMHRQIFDTIDFTAVEGEMDALQCGNAQGAYYQGDKAFAATVIEPVTRDGWTANENFVTACLDGPLSAQGL